MPARVRAWHGRDDVAAFIQQRESPRSPGAFTVSERYSSFVGMMKLVLPLGAALLVFIVVAWPYLGGRDAGISLSFASNRPRPRRETYS